MKTEEEAKMWEALELLIKAEYTIGRNAGKTKAKQVFHDFEEARGKIKEADALITPLRDL